MADLTVLPVSVLSYQALTLFESTNRGQTHKLRDISKTLVQLEVIRSILVTRVPVRYWRVGLNKGARAFRGVDGRRAPTERRFRLPFGFPPFWRSYNLTFLHFLHYHSATSRHFQAALTRRKAVENRHVSDGERQIVKS